MKQILPLSHSRKSYDGKVVLDVTLAFLPGAKIGVVDQNGTGKSTLPRMMVGLEQPSNGDVRLMPGVHHPDVLWGQDGTDRASSRIVLARLSRPVASGA